MLIETLKAVSMFLCIALFNIFFTVEERYKDNHWRVNLSFFGSKCLYASLNRPALDFW